MKEYSNNEITVVWDDSKCIHSGNCARGLNSVFKPKERPWIDMQGSSSAQIMKVIDTCPSKALTYRKGA